MAYLVAAIILGASLVAAAIILRAVIEKKAEREQDGASLALIQNQVNASVEQTVQQVENLRKTLGESLQGLSDHMSRSLADSSKTVGERLDNTSRVIGDVRQQLGQLEASSKRMIDIGQDIAKLEDILQPPKLRGSLGELFLSDLLAQILPNTHYDLQYSFKGGETVDAVVILRSGIVPIDAKFPLENFKRIFSAEDDNTRKSAKKAFVKDVKVHIDAIATKYIRTDEKTFDFALMYIPAENVYYETIIKDDEFGGDMALFSYALSKRVIPVSPNSFYAYLQTIILGLKGMQVEERSREIVQGLSRLKKEFDRFTEAFRLVGQHLDNSTKKYAEAEKRFARVESKVEQIDGLAHGLESEQIDASADAHPALPEMS